jgi:diguanylate cyclase (GGDEF)-like protein/PAS domain S-box-containing protein
VEIATIDRAGWLTRLRDVLPEGQTLPEAEWRRRHHAMVALLFAEAIGLAIFAFAEGYSLPHSVAHAAPLLPLGVMALLIERSRRLAAILVSIGLITACALLVHVWHGAIEGHFLFFVTIVILALYEDWVPFLLAAAYVVIHHGLMGAVDPGGVYNHPDAVAHPWKWAVIHGGFVVAAGLASVAAWRLNENVRRESLEAYSRARQSEERFRAAFEGAPIGMLLFTAGGDQPGAVLQVNRALCEITGHDESHLRAERLHDVVHPDDMPAGIAAAERVVRGEATQIEVRYIHADGHTVWVSVSMSLLHPAESGQPAYAIAQIQDITESKRSGEMLTYQAMHDELTGLPNRRSLFADLEMMISQASEAPMLLLLFDLNGFKAYNDTFGHPAGDALLSRVGKRLQTSLDEHATAYRMGGDEFCVLARPNGNGHKSIATAAEAALREKGEGFEVTASYGSVLLPEEALTAEAGMRIADQRMYARKSLDSRTSAGRQSTNVLLTILSERSPDLGVHLDEVTGLSEAVANALGVPDEEMASLLQAASLHDVGKAAIPDEILQKPGALEDEEWEFIRQHTVIGERILAAAPALSRAAKLVRASHERVDGDGYPDGLVGDQIPLGARIIAVCDAYDAMLSDRPYRKPKGREEALAELRRCSGTQFDPDVVDAFADAITDRDERSSRVAEKLG